MSASKVVLRPDAALKITPTQRTEDIVKALNEVLENLRNVETADIHARSAKTLAVHFAQEGFLQHSDSHVRALLAACLAEMFRIFVGTPEDVISSQEAPAPTGPYSDIGVLKNVFEFLIEQLAKFLNRKSNYYGLGYHVAQVLASTKAYMLVFSIEDHQTVLEELVRLFFDVVSEAHTTADKITFLDILVGLVGDEDTTLTHQLLAILLAPLTRNGKRQNPSAYGLAKDLFKRIPKALEPCISAYFYQILQHESFSDEADIKENVPELILELFEITPQLVTSTLKHLDQQITSGVVKDRTDCLSLIDRLFTSPNFVECGSAERDLVIKFAVGRLSDVDDKARALAVRVGQHFVCSQKNYDEQTRVKEYVEHLGNKLMDPCPLVRSELVKAFCVICKVALDYVSSSVIGSLGERLLDKETSVRESCATSVCELFNHLLYPGNDTVAISNDKVRPKLGPLLVKFIDTMLIIPDKTTEFKFLAKLLPPDAGEYVFSSHFVYFYVCCSKRGRQFFQDNLRRNHHVRLHLLDLLSGDIIQDVSKRNEFKRRIIQYVPLFKTTEKGLDQLLDQMKEDKQFRRVVSNFALLTGTTYLQNMEEVLKKCGNNVPGNEKYIAARRLLEVVVPFRLNDRQLNNIYTRIFEILNGYITTSEVLCPAAALPIQPELLRSRSADLLKVLGRLTPTLFTCGPPTSSITFALNKAVRMWRDRDVEVANHIFQFLAAVAPGLRGVQVHRTALEELIGKTKEFMGKEGNLVTGNEAKFAVRIINEVCNDRLDIFKQILQWADDVLDPASDEDQHRIAAAAALGELASITSPTKEVLSDTSSQKVESIKDEVAAVIFHRLTKSIQFDNLEGDDQLDSEEWVGIEQLPVDVQVVIHSIKSAGKYIRSCITPLKLATPQQKSFLKTFFEKIKEGLLDPSQKLSSLDTISHEHLVLALSFQLIKTIPSAIGHLDAKLNYLAPLLSVFPKLSVEDARDEYMRYLMYAIFNEIEPGRLLAAICSAAYPSDNKSVPFKSLVIKPGLEAVRRLRRQVLLDGNRFALCVPELSLLYLIHTLAIDPEFKDPEKLKSCIPWFEKQGPAIYCLIDILVTDHQQYSPGIIAKLMQVTKKGQLAGHLASSKVHLKAYVLCDFVLALLDKRIPNGSKQECPIPLHFPKDILEIDKNAQNVNVANPPCYFNVQVSTSKRTDGTVAVFLGSSQERTASKTSECSATKSARKRSHRSRSSHAESEGTEPGEADSEPMDVE